MTPNDPRHGQERGYFAHRKAGEQPCVRCLKAHSVAEKKRQLLRWNDGGSVLPALGTQRRLQALVRLGWPVAWIAREHGQARETVKKILAHDSIQRRTAEQIAATYDRLSMRLPNPKTEQERASVTKAIARAEREGWPPPLAWEDIDDPNEKPVGWRYLPPDRAEAIADLDERGAGISEVCRVLAISRDTLERWCVRHGHWETFQRLRAREPVQQAYRNQYSKEAS